MQEPVKQQAPPCFTKEQTEALKQFAGVNEYYPNVWEVQQASKIFKARLADFSQGVAVRYTGTYTARAQAQNKAILRQTVKRAQGITNPEYMKMLFDFCTQLQHIDTGRASQAEEIRNSIHIYTAYHKDLEELKLMQGLVFEVATMKARKAQRAARWAKREQELLQSTAQAAV